MHLSFFLCGYLFSFPTLLSSCLYPSLLLNCCLLQSGRYCMSTFPTTSQISPSHVLCFPIETVKVESAMPETLLNISSVRCFIKSAMLGFFLVGFKGHSMPTQPDERIPWTHIGSGFFGWVEVGDSMDRTILARPTDARSDWNRELSGQVNDLSSFFQCVTRGDTVEAW